VIEDDSESLRMGIESIWGEMGNVAEHQQKWQAMVGASRAQLGVREVERLMLTAKTFVREQTESYAEIHSKLCSLLMSQKCSALNLAQS
jgi:hypothetical protein